MDLCSDGENSKHGRMADYVSITLFCLRGKGRENEIK